MEKKISYCGIAGEIKSQFLHSRDLLFPGKSESARVSRVYLRLFARACSPSCRWAKQGETRRREVSLHPERDVVRSIDRRLSISFLLSETFSGARQCTAVGRVRILLFTALTFFHNQNNMSPKSCVNLRDFRR